MSSKYLSKNFGLKHRVISSVSRRLSYVTYTSRSGITKGLRRRGGLGFVPEMFGEVTAELKFLRSLPLTNAVVYDIGTFHGLMTLFFASKAKRVVSYEANPDNLGRIVDNLRLNRFRNCMLRNVALGAGDGLLRFHYDESMVGAATGDPEIAEEIRNSSQHVEFFEVPMTSLDLDISRFDLPLPTFVKIDVEGMEIEVLRGMQQVLQAHSPALYIELHGTTPDDKRKNAQGVGDILFAHNYNVFDVENDQYLQRDVPLSGKESHVYASKSQERPLA
jgi:FkbM family methyltransferase